MFFCVPVTCTNVNAAEYLIWMSLWSSFTNFQTNTVWVLKGYRLRKSGILATIWWHWEQTTSFLPLEFLGCIGKVLFELRIVSCPVSPSRKPDGSPILMNPRDHCDEVGKKGRKMKNRASMKRQHKNQMPKFYNVGWHMAYAAQEGSLTSGTTGCGLPWMGPRVGSMVPLPDTSKSPFQPNLFCGVIFMFYAVIPQRTDYFRWLGRKLWYYFYIFLIWVKMFKNRSLKWSIMVRKRKMEKADAQSS